MTMAFENELQASPHDLAIPPGEARCHEMNPFRGLEFFDLEHVTLFYGRRKIAEEALDLLRQQVADKKPFLLVLGPAASGKTSLIRAGILPALTRPGGTEEADYSWRLVFTRPGNGGAGDPFDALAAALLEKSALPEFPDAAIPNGWQDLAAELREAPDNTALRLRETLQCLGVQALDHLLDQQGSDVPHPDPDESVELPRQSRPERLDSKVRLVLVVDQLEELFLPGFSPEVQQRFITALGALVRWRVAVVIAGLQSDFYGSFEKCCRPQDVGVRNQSELSARNIDLSEFLTGRFDVQPPSPQEIGEMIRLPAEAAGLRFELDPETGRTLDAALLAAAIPCSEPLPAVENLLWQLYRKQLLRKDGLLRWSDYRESGGLEGALANQAECVFRSLDQDAQAALKPVVRQLVSPGPDDDGVLMGRTVPYRDLTSTPEFSEHEKAGAKRLVDLFVKEGFFHSEKGPNAEVLVAFTQECVFRNWQRVRGLLNEDLGLLRTRDRLEPNFKLWVSGGRRSRNLVRTPSGVRDAQTLLRGFQGSLSDSQVDYLQRSLRAKSQRRWLQGAGIIAIIAGLFTPFVIPGVQWLGRNIERRKAEQPSNSEGRVAHSVETSPEFSKAGQRQNGDNAQLPQGNTPVAISQRDALQSRLNGAEAKTQQIQKSLELALQQRDALQSRLNDAETRAQGIQKSLELTTSQRDGLQSRLKDAEAKAEQAQKDEAQAGIQRDALKSQLEDTEAKAQQAQKDAAQATTRRAALQNQLTETEAKVQQAQKDAAPAASQGDALQGQLKETETKAQQAEKNAALAASQRDALQQQLKETETKAQQTQNDAELAASQRDALQGQLKETEAKAQQAQKDAELATSQRDALQGQLKELTRKSAQFPAGQRDALQTQLNAAEAREQQAQKDAAQAASQRDGLQKQLKDTDTRAQQAQKDAEVATRQRDALENQLKDTEAKAQQAQKDAELATSQRDALQGQLKETEARAQQAQKDTEVAKRQRDALQNQLNDTEAKVQQTQKAVELAASQRDAVQNQLKNSEARAQQAQKDAGLATSQRDALQSQLKNTQAKAEQAQKDAALAGSERDKLQNQLKDAEAKGLRFQRDAGLATMQRDALEGQLQQARKDAEVTAGQRDALQARLTEAEARTQLAQKNADLAINQRDALQAQLKDAQTKQQQTQKDALLAANQPAALQNQPKTAEAGTNASQQDVDSPADQSPPQQEPQSATSEAAPVPVPGTPQGDNGPATATQNQTHRSPSEPTRPQKAHRTRETRTRNSAERSPQILSQLRYHWNRFWWRLRANAP